MNKKQEKAKVGENKIKEFMREGLDYLDNMLSQPEAENMIKDNKLEFPYKGKNYRIRKPNIEEQRTLAKKSREKYTELVKDESYMFEKQWLELLKKKGIDIEEMKKEAQQINHEITPLLLKMAKTKDKKALDKLKESINNKRDKQAEIHSEIFRHLEFSIESQVKIQETAYMAYQVTEVMNIDKAWVPVFESYEDYDACDDMVLLNLIHYFLNLIIYKQEE